MKKGHAIKSTWKNNYFLYRLMLSHPFQINEAFLILKAISTIPNLWNNHTSSNIKELKETRHHLYEKIAHWILWHIFLFKNLILKVLCYNISIEISSSSFIFKYPNTWLVMMSSTINHDIIVHYIIGFFRPLSNVYILIST